MHVTFRKQYDLGINPHAQIIRFTKNELSSDKHRSAITLHSILAYNLQTEFKEGFYTRISYTGAMSRKLKYTKSQQNFNTTSYYDLRDLA